MKVKCLYLITLTNCFLWFQIKCASDNPSLLSNIISFAVNLTTLVPIIFPQYPNKNVRDRSTYDFIIIGSGPSGSVIANRLSEIRQWKILLLEAGGEPSLPVNVPATCGTLEFSDFNWGYKSERQTGFCRGCSDETLQWPHGKVLGGSSGINYMIFVRGNSLDYDKWAQMGNPGWSYKEVLPYLKKVEDVYIEINDEGYRGKGGYLTVTDVPYRSEAVKAYVQAAQEAGYHYVDYNGKHQLGVSFVQATLRNGSRCSAEKAYLRPVRNRPNLTIVTNARVTRILINPQNKQTYGVTYYKNGEYVTVFVNNEVIVSAGVLNSPQLLMLSGIGPRSHLEELGIPVLQDLPVGEKIYDHPSFPAISFQLNQSIGFKLSDFFEASTFFDYFFKGKGPFTTIGGVEAVTYMKTKSSPEPNSSRPDVELMFLGGDISLDLGLVFRRIYNFPEETYRKFWQPLEFLPGYQVIPMLLHPQSKGFMKLRSRNPFQSPRYYANYFSDSDNTDIKSYLEAIREIERINQSPSMQKYGGKLVTIPLPGCEEHTFNSDAYWVCALRTIIASTYHQVSTCKMGPASDPEAVVDSKLRVHGIKKLRVADIGVVPVTLSAHTAGPAYMIGEKASDIIKKDWGIQWLE